MLYQQLFFRRVLDGACDPLPVLRSKDQRAQDQQIQGALQQFQTFPVILGRHITRVSTLRVKCQPKESGVADPAWRVHRRHS
jgi:hypothetical protein